MSDTNGTMNMGAIMAILFVILVIWLIFGGGIGRNAQAAEAAYLRNGDCAGTSNCQVEKQTIINTANLQFETLNQARNTQDVVREENDKVREQASRIYEAQQAEKLFDCKMELYAERQGRDADRRSYEQERRSDRQYNALSRQLEALSCEVPKRPPYYAKGGIACIQDCSSE